MMISMIKNIARLEAMLVNQNNGKSEFATVSSYNPKTYMAKVIFEERQERTESAWMQIMTMSVGNGWGWFTPPPIGALVVVDFVGGDKEVGVIRGGVFNREDRCLAVPSGEMWLVHETGSCLKLTNDGKVKLSGETELDLNSVHVKAGDSSQPFQKLVSEAFLAFYNLHTHIVTTPGNPTSTPIVPMTTAHLTTALKGN